MVLWLLMPIEDYWLSCMTLQKGSLYSWTRDSPRYLFQVSGFQDSKSETDVDVDYNSLYSRQDFLKGKDSELSWFNAGVPIIPCSFIFSVVP
jgi:regulation of enolase protein 1 (concanavalin A-like superfamily)